MPRTIEHKIKLLDRPATPPADPSSVEYRPEYGGGTLSSSGRGEGHFPQFSTAHREQEEEKEGNWPMGNSRSRSHIAPEKPARRYHYESKQGDEVTYGTESFERNLRYSPNEIERQHFSSRSFGERNSLGGDGESRANVRFEDEAEPVRPIDPDYDNPAPFAHPTHRSSDEWEAEARPDQADGRVRLLHRTKHLDTTPIRIPRPRVDSPGKNGTIPSKSPSSKWHHSQPSQKALPPPLSFSSSVGPSRQSWHTSSSGLGQSEPEQRAANRGHQSPSSVDSSGGAYSSVAMPMKKVIRKSRWVSIHDGRPVTKFVETVHYEPAIGGSRSAVDGQRHAHFSPELWTSSSSCSLSSVDEASGDGKERGKWKDGERCQPNSSRIPPPSQSVHVTQNPVYSIGL